MRDRRAFLKLGIAAAMGALAGPRAAAGATPLTPDPRERHLSNVRQLTSGGQNAEAYWDATCTRLIFQSTRPPYGCDQIFTMKDDGSDLRLVSTGKGRTTCGFFFPDGKRLIYASTHFGGDACPPPPERTGGYVWPIFPTYEIVSADADGGNVRRLTDNQGYDAEGVVSPDGKEIVFTSLRNGDLDLYVMNADGGNVRRLTDRPGYDGGAFFSWDGRWIVFRAGRPDTAAALAEYRALLQRGLVRPGALEIYLMWADGTRLTQVTRAGAASFAPFLHPNNQQIIFSSNLHDPSGRSFALYLVNVDGSGLERVTFADSFASFPMFSRDGKRLVFTANRNAAAPRRHSGGARRSPARCRGERAMRRRIDQGRGETFSDHHGEIVLEKHPTWVDRAVVKPFKDPLAKEGGLVALFGSLAPNGAILKRSAADPKLFEREGRAVVFSSLDDLSARIDDPQLDVTADDFLVLQNAGPKSGYAMPEAGYLPIPQKLARAGVKDMVRISDARMSGTAYGTIVLHVSPEAAVGGALALVRNGDRIRLSVKDRRSDLQISEREMMGRKAAWQPLVAPPTRGYAKLYMDHVLQAEHGCDFDFLRKA